MHRLLRVLYVDTKRTADKTLHRPPLHLMKPANPLRAIFSDAIKHTNNLCYTAGIFFTNNFSLLSWNPISIALSNVIFFILFFSTISSKSTMLYSQIQTYWDQRLLTAWH